MPSTRRFILSGLVGGPLTAGVLFLWFHFGFGLTLVASVWAALAVGLVIALVVPFAFWSFYSAQQLNEHQPAREIPPRGDKRTRALRFSINLALIQLLLVVLAIALLDGTMRLSFILLSVAVALAIILSQWSGRRK